VGNGPRVEDGEDLFPSDGWVESEKVVHGFAAFQKINETLDGYARIAEARGTAQPAGVYPNGFFQIRTLRIAHETRLAIC
jgi:hypothetical protein